MLIKLSSLNTNKIEKFKKDLQTAFTAYNDVLCEKKFEIKYVEKPGTKAKYFSIYCKKSNFMHLVGVKSYKECCPPEKPTKAVNFYEDLILDNIDPEKVWVKSDLSEIQRKLDVLKYCELLITKDCRICLSSGDTYEKIEFAYALRTGKKLLALTFIKDDEDNRRHVPISTINVTPSESKSYDNVFDNVIIPKTIKEITNKESIMVFDFNQLQKKKKRKRKN